MQSEADQVNVRKQILRSIQDSMYVLEGKWKVSIISSLCCFNKRRFTDISNDITGISNRMLSKELKELETNNIIKRSILDTRPVTVQYELTEHGRTLQPIMKNLAEWGLLHRNEIIGNRQSNL